MTATVQHRQTALDVALQYFGSAEAVFTVAERLGVSITDPLPVGATFEYAAAEIIDKSVADKYQDNGIIPTTEIEK